MIQSSHTPCSRPHGARPQCATPPGESFVTLQNPSVGNQDGAVESQRACKPRLHLMPAMPHPERCQWGWGWLQSRFMAAAANAGVSCMPAGSPRCTCLDADALEHWQFRLLCASDRIPVAFNFLAVHCTLPPSPTAHVNSQNGGQCYFKYDWETDTTTPTCSDPCEQEWLTCLERGLPYNVHVEVWLRLHHETSHTLAKASRS